MEIIWRWGRVLGVVLGGMDVSLTMRWCTEDGRDSAVRRRTELYGAARCCTVLYGAVRCYSNGSLLLVYANGHGYGCGYGYRLNPTGIAEQD